jgi:hypothetical protein
MFHIGRLALYLCVFVVTVSCTTIDGKRTSTLEIKNFSPEMVSKELEEEILEKLFKRLAEVSLENDNIVSGDLRDYAIQLYPLFFRNVGDVWAYYGVEVILIHRSDRMYKDGIWKTNPIHGTGDPKTLVSTIYTFNDHDLVPLSDGNLGVSQVFTKWWKTAEKNTGGGTESQISGEFD